MQDKPSRQARGGQSDRSSADSSAGGPPDTARNVKVAGLAMVIALALMAVFNSSELRSYTRDLPDSRLSDALVLYADQWHALMLALGPAHVRIAVRDLFDRFREMRW